MPHMVRNLLFACLLVFGFFLGVEVVARLVLCVDKSSPAYLLFGLHDCFLQKRFQQSISQDGHTTYYRGIPTENRCNPVNSLGCRGPDIQPKRPAMKRIICLGGSTTYGDGLNYHETYPFLLQKKLHALWGSQPFDIINAGQPGMTLEQIIAFTGDELLCLDPDAVIIMSINNNLKAPGFWFVDVQQAGGPAGQSQPVHIVPKTNLLRLKSFLVRKSALAYYMDRLTTNWLAAYFMHFDYAAFARALMAENNIWEQAFADNLEHLINMLGAHNPEIRIILLEEAVNSVDYQALEAPFAKARAVMRRLAHNHPNAFCLDVQTPIIQAAQSGGSVWQARSYDPLHLSAEGNAIIADTIAKFLLSNRNDIFLNVGLHDRHDTAAAARRSQKE